LSPFGVQVARHLPGYIALEVNPYWHIEFPGLCGDERIGVRALLDDIEQSLGVGGVVRRGNEYGQTRRRPNQWIAGEHRSFGSRALRVRRGGKAYCDAHDTTVRLTRLATPQT
jgi:hypothetical protein